MGENSPLVLSQHLAPVCRSLGRSVRFTGRQTEDILSLSLLRANKEHSNYFGCAVSGRSICDPSSPLLPSFHPSALTCSFPFLHTFRISDSQGPLRHCCGPQWPKPRTETELECSSVPQKPRKRRRIHASRTAKCACVADRTIHSFPHS